MEKNMRREIIKLQGSEKWTAFELYRFLHYTNIVYNRLIILEKHKHNDYDDLMKRLRLSFKYIEDTETLSVSSLSINSPFNISFEGSGEIIRQLREFWKDWKFRNDQEKELGKLRIDQERELGQLRILREKNNLYYELGFSEQEVREIMKSLTTPLKKLIKNSNNASLINDDNE